MGLVSMVGGGDSCGGNALAPCSTEGEGGLCSPMSSSMVAISGREGMGGGGEVGGPGGGLAGGIGGTSGKMEEVSDGRLNFETSSLTDLRLAATSTSSSFTSSVVTGFVVSGGTSSSVGSRHSLRLFHLFSLLISSGSL